MRTPSALLRLMGPPGRKYFLSTSSSSAKVSLVVHNNLRRSPCKTEHALFRQCASTTTIKVNSYSHFSKTFQTSVQLKKCSSSTVDSAATSASKWNNGEARCNVNYLFESSDAETEETVRQDFEVHEDFVSEDEEKCLFEEAEDYLEDVEYEYDHWDNAIHGYRETEKSRWSEESQAILRRVRQTAFPSGEQQLTLVHILDLAQDGYIKPHVDSVKFCGSTITGLSLLSAAVMRLAKEDEPERWVNILLKPRTLYVMKGKARYQFTHEILKDSESLFCGKKVPRHRRISVMCRNEPTS